MRTPPSSPREIDEYHFMARERGFAMLSFTRIYGLFSTKSAHARSARRNARTAPALESLEGRELMTHAMFNFRQMFQVGMMTPASPGPKSTQKLVLWQQSGLGSSRFPFGQNGSQQVGMSTP